MNNNIVKACVIGDPVEHSLSPLIHTYWLNAYEISGCYSAHAIAAGQLQKGVKKLIDEGYAGFNVTIPHKQAVMDLCDEINETARSIGAVNTVIIGEDKKLTGMNTDVRGFIENILQERPAFDFEDKTALVLGAGGAARAVVYGLKASGVKIIYVANRTEGKAQKIAADFGCKVLSWAERVSHATDTDIIVNTTSLGMAGQGALEFDLADFSKDTLVCDIVYKPLDTNLILAAKQRGMPYVTGIGMLLHQAQPAFQEWFGFWPEVTEDLKKKALEAAQ